jgi:putative effector of murein hydrolase
MRHGRRGIPYERSHERLLPPFEFGLRLVTHLLLALVLVAICLGIGAIGYHHYAHLNWVDSIFNASMILTGMGPAEPLANDDAKIFASCYAIFSGVAFLSIVGLLMAPVVHRFLHAFHLEVSGE